MPRCRRARKRPASIRSTTIRPPQELQAENAVRGQPRGGGKVATTCDPQYGQATVSNGGSGDICCGRSIAGMAVRALAQE